MTAHTAAIAARRQTYARDIQEVHLGAAMNSVNSRFANWPGGSASLVRPDDRTDASRELTGCDANGLSPEVTPAEVKVGVMTQDLRLAVTMSGGVSLAVRMGGVAHEINLRQRATNFRVNDDSGGSKGRSPDADSAAPAREGSSSAADLDLDARSRGLYLALLKLLDLKVKVDVLSGTSAGGINASPRNGGHIGLKGRDNTRSQSR
jgi:hypothetical protein